MTRLLASQPRSILLLAAWGAGAGLLAPAPLSAVVTTAPYQVPDELAAVFNLVSDDAAVAEAAANTLSERWHDSYAVMLVELAALVSGPAVWKRTFSVLERGTGQSFKWDHQKWYDWIWRTNPGTHPRYAEYKALLYENVDPGFREYFDDNPPTAIRLDEIAWGGVVRDGIPPLDRPTTIPASEATYLDDDNVVFGLEINGDARAYPKRILAWHEMVKDVVGGESINGVYCTLCGSMIVYRTVANGVHHELGTSGFLYRSNKLMYDHATKSLWSTLQGAPVVGPLVGQGIVLEHLFVVTTTWREWRERHPRSTVLSLDTGYERDYSEGAAYREYFSHDDLMFTVPKLDRRLKNKAEVLGLRFREAPGEQLAIAVDYLADRRVYHGKLGQVTFVVLTDASGASRVYETSGQRFKAWDGRHAVRDEAGHRWRLGETALTREDGATNLRRLPAHRAFWFGWYAAFSDTKLIK